MDDAVVVKITEYAMGGVMEHRNAVIRKAVIRNDERAGLTAILDLDYDGLHQNFGYFCLYRVSGDGGRIDEMGHFVYKALEVAGVDDWDDLPGKAVRVVCDAVHIEKIGHIIKDIWFNPGEEICYTREPAAAETKERNDE